MLPLHGAIINWFAHQHDSINFKMKNTSANLFKVDIFMMGEACNNNHHRNPSGINFSYRWHEMNPAYAVIRIHNAGDPARHFA